VNANAPAIVNIISRVNPKIIVRCWLHRSDKDQDFNADGKSSEEVDMLKQIETLMKIVFWVVVIITILAMARNAGLI
jgi:hypothetical protein